jgi:hypothetical protein
MRATGGDGERQCTGVDTLFFLGAWRWPTWLRSWEPSATAAADDPPTPDRWAGAKPAKPARPGSDPTYPLLRYASATDAL